MKARIRTSQLLAPILLLAIAFSDSAWEESCRWTETALSVCGILLVAIAATGRLWCSLYVAGYKSDRLVTVGPYSVSRNPLYFFSLLGGIGVGLCTETFTFPLVIAIFFCIHYPGAIRAEEKALSAKFEDEYAAYVRRTPRFLPRFSLLHEPEEYTVKPRIYRKHALDALWFFLAVGIIEAIDALQGTVALPTIVHLY